MAKEMLINTVERQECRIAILDNRVLTELYLERGSSASRVGNIYKGKVTNVEPAIQAAFVDFGLARNGFLHISDVNRQYFPKGRKGAEPIGRKRSHKDRPPIQECLRRGQEVVVQMTKEGIGTKGPTLTTYLSIPGKLLVMMPGMSRLGVSRKVEDEDARSAARQLLADLQVPPDMGLIVRTAGITSTKKELKQDLNYLTRLWKAVDQRINSAKAPAEIYQESDLVTRTIRDVYNADIHRVICDNRAVAQKVKEFLDVAMPRTKHTIEVYTGKKGLFHDYGVEEEIEKIYARRVELPSGGSLVIDQAEALVAIDINSGRFRDHSDAETTALKMNLEAAAELARQLRLRDLGGVIVIDFIDMREPKHRREVEKALRDAMKPDRAKTKVLKMSSFCIVELTRQRVRPSLKDSIYRKCEACGGSGFLKSEESLALQVMRNIQRAASVEDVANVSVKVNPEVAHYLLNRQRGGLSHVEARTDTRITVYASKDVLGDSVEIVCTNHRGSVVPWDQEATKQVEQPLETVSVDELPPDSPVKEPAKAGKPQAPAAKLPAIQAPPPRAEEEEGPEAVEPAEPAELPAAPAEPLPAPTVTAQPTPPAQSAPPAAAPPEGGKKKSRRRRRRRRKSASGPQQPPQPADEAQAAAANPPAPPPAENLPPTT